MIDATGRWYVWCFAQGAAAGDPVLYGQQTNLATGGSLASGQIGLYDAHPNADARTRSFDNFVAWVPNADAVVNPSQSAELRWDGMFREDTGGTAYGPVSQVVGDLPRLPPTVEGRSTEVFVKASRGDLGGLPDSGIDDISARLSYRPCWLTVPGT
jgi:hypothetical protein